MGLSQPSVALDLGLLPSFLLSNDDWLFSALEPRGPSNSDGFPGSNEKSGEKRVMEKKIRINVSYIFDHYSGSVSGIGVNCN